MASSDYSQIKNEFNFEAQKVDGMFSKNHTECDRLSIKFLKQWVTPEKDVLEIGMGMGNVIENLPCNRFGLDLSEEMLKNSFIQNKWVGNMDELPFGNQTFDLVYMIMTFQQSLDEKKTLSEMKRVCKDGGMMIIIDGDKDSLIGKGREKQIKKGTWQMVGDAKWLSQKDFPEWRSGHLAPHIIWLMQIK